ncbi:MAG: hypothetical protein JRN18_02520 [Nitrososphaerota archaeon]|nr:hypothetical protein [Nitrososphaerota archaeon]MDG6917628.1 hypothetical protein [Nitrososphaerota archaeon]MDG6919214.1 hypothetical protein [Nitrososphaerota archaeon]MDG6946749.1 hypothetical protein [Nitrososphaerota archaeon]
MAPGALNNYITKSRARVKGDKKTSASEFSRLLVLARPVLSEQTTRSLKADLNGVVIELETNSDHQAEFWETNWAKADPSAPAKAKIYSAMGVEGVEPSAYYCPDLKSALFLNTEYYGQCKSWALGIAAAVLERESDTLSIHGATALYRDKGVVIIAPTGTGKTTQAFQIFMDAAGKICGDDWAYVRFPNPVPKTPSRPLVARQPERALYMRSESQKEQGWLREVFDRSMGENITSSKEECEFPEGEAGCSVTHQRCVFNDGKKWCYYAFGNSRVLVKREDLLGPGKVVDEVPVNLVVLLRRDDHSPAEVRLAPKEAIDILRRGEYMILPGAGPKEKWGSMSYEPWYNPYLLEEDHDRQARFFSLMFATWNVPCMILNTGVEGVKASHDRIIAALDEH